MKKTPRWWWGVLILMAFIVGGLWYWGMLGGDQPETATDGKMATPSSPGPAQPVIERFPVKTLVAEKRDLEVTLAVFGTITYFDKVEVASEIHGVLKEVMVRPGDMVKKGQVLAVLDTELLERDLEARRAMRAQAQAQLKNARWQYQAQNKLYQAGGASLSDREEAEAQYKARQAEVRRFSRVLAHCSAAGVVQDLFEFTKHE